MPLLQLPPSRCGSKCLKTQKMTALLIEKDWFTLPVISLAGQTLDAEADEMVLFPQTLISLKSG